MEETREQQRLYSFFQSGLYFFICLEVLLSSGFLKQLCPQVLHEVLIYLETFPPFYPIWQAKGVTLLMIMIVSVGTRPRKTMESNLVLYSVAPILTGMLLLILSIWIHRQWFMEGDPLYGLVAYGLPSLFGAVLLHLGLDNVTKSIRHLLLKDLWNLENERFAQNTKLIRTSYSVNLETRFYYKKRKRKGWLNITNPFRGTMVIGTPGSGKTYSVIIPYMCQLIEKGFTMVIYDFKYPDLTGIAYAAYQKQQQKGRLKNYAFQVINLDDPAGSARVNPLDPSYLTSLPQAVETAEALIYALRKSDHPTGSDQFFTQSAINMLAAVIYFLARYRSGKCSTFAHVLSFLQLDYERMFFLLEKDLEVRPLVAPFISAYKQQATDQLEGQLGTLRINLARLATKEVYWVLSGNEINLRINDPDKPAILVLASSPETQEINSACYALVINRLTKLINQKNRLPCALIIDELPTLYIHRLENLLATARSNKVAVLLGLQELPQFRQLYGKLAAETICAVVANVISGQVRSKETLEWLQEVFGKIKQLKQGIHLDRFRYSVSSSEQMDYVIPAAKIASLSTGVFVGSLAAENKVQGAGLLHALILGKAFPSTLPKSIKSNHPILLDYYRGIESQIREVQK
jgi:hypothetical protein